MCQRFGGVDRGHPLTELVERDLAPSEAIADDALCLKAVIVTNPKAAGS